MLGPRRAGILEPRATSLISLPETFRLISNMWRNRENWDKPIDPGLLFQTNDKLVDPGLLIQMNAWLWLMPDS